MAEEIRRVVPTAVGARIFRAHDVRATRQALDVVAAIRGDLPLARAVRDLA